MVDGARRPATAPTAPIRPLRTAATTRPLTFEERLGLLVDREAQDRDNRRLERYLRATKLRLSGASLENLDFGLPCGLDRAPAGPEEDH